MLLKYKDDGDWEETMASVLFAYRTSRHSSTKFTPFFLMYGRYELFPLFNLFDIIKHNTWTFHYSISEFKIKFLNIFFM